MTELGKECVYTCNPICMYTLRVFNIEKYKFTPIPSDQARLTSPYLYRSSLRAWLPVWGQSPDLAGWIPTPLVFGL